MLVGINRTYAYELDVRGVHNLYKKLPTATKSVENTTVAMAMTPATYAVGLHSAMHS